MLQGEQKTVQSAPDNGNYKCSDSVDDLSWELAAFYRTDDADNQRRPTQIPTSRESLPFLPEHLAKIQSLEVETAARLSLEGQMFLQADEPGHDGHYYCSMSRALAEQGELRASIREASKALFMGETSNDEYLVALAKRNLGIAYSFAGRFDVAEKLTKDAIETALGFSANRRDSILSDSYRVLGDIALRRSKFDLAIEHYRLALESGGSPTVPLALANAYIGAGETGRAELLIREISQSKDGLPPFLLERAMGDLETARGNFQQAAVHYGAAARDSGRPDHAYHKFVALAGLARAHARAGNEQAALKDYRDAVDIAELVRARFRSEEFKTGFFGRIQDVFDEAVALHMDAGEDRKAFELSERSRSRALLDMVRNRVQFSKASAAFFEAQRDSVSLEQVQQSLATGYMLLTYHTTEARTVAWKIGPSTFESVTLDFGHADLTQAVMEYRRTIQQRKPFREQSRELYVRLIDPLQLRGGDTLVLVPHSSLHYLPFQSLSNGRRFLGQEYDVVYAPSSGVLIDLLERGTRRRDNLLAFGNPDVGDPRLDLPGAQREVKQVSALIEHASVFTRTGATEVRFKAMAPSFSVLHVAAHAEVDEIDPLYSFIRLAPTGEVSGDLEAHEIYRLDLSDAELVTLSACDTGLGKIARGDEIWGFYRTFLGAGASALLVSLWPIDDVATERFMVAFYDALRTQTPAAAMRHARRTLMENTAYAHPFYWSAFNYIGSPM